MKYRITYSTSRSDEIVEADHFSDSKDHRWIDFYTVSSNGQAAKVVLRVAAADVERVQQEG